MKRIVKFREDSEKYMLFEESSMIFEMDKAKLQFDIKKFYQVFFAGDLDYTEIELINEVQNNKEALFIFNTINQLISEVVDKLKIEFPEIQPSSDALVEEDFTVTE